LSETETNAETAPHEDVILAFIDILGFSDKVQEIGLETIYAIYRSDVLEAVQEKSKESLITCRVPEEDGTISTGVCIRPISSAWFSDTILLWAKYESAIVDWFLYNVNDLFCRLLAKNIPVRGAISFGDAILRPDDGIFLGQPIIDGARCEAAQQWLGITFGPSLLDSPRWLGDMTKIAPYNSHIKSGREDMAAKVVLNWTTQWDSERSGLTPREAVSKLNTNPNFTQYYENTIAFIDRLDTEADWWRSTDPASIGVAGYVMNTVAEQTDAVEP